MKLIYAVAFLLSLSLFGGCVSTNRAKGFECVSKQSKNLIIRWGDFDTNYEKTLGYQIESNGVLSMVTNTGTDMNSYKTEKICDIDGVKYCRILELTNDLLMKSQAIAMPGEKVNFIEYINPNNGMYLRGFWNPKFKNAGNKEFIKLFDSLMTLVPSVK